ncbi:MOSC domain-containing protein [Paenibacillus sp. JX-17]|uniref:MOSC domain-containing protein n=1 Tax=Paenibacillus lacisoli TaxID=3064525 RepID=A0ABT9CDP0_9BACL|nr:MOSC domain-containing protein [Paenibacillus sp. JX-17]MDO7907384.1 MOSC domain-containing protein [Paenibacillus sp. JX-17]
MKAVYESGVTQVLSVNAGMPQSMMNGSHTFETGIIKRPVEGEQTLSLEGLAGDGQADLKNHGGPDKALCVYDRSRYAFYEERLARELDAGAFGENLTVSGLDEEQVCIGDVYRLGSAIVQLSQPRQPCFKLGVRYNFKELPVLFQQSGYTGYYYRVLEAGTFQSGCELVLLERPEDSMTVMQANRIMYHRKQDAEAIRQLLGIQALSVSWKQQLQKRLDSLETLAD